MINYEKLYKEAIERMKSWVRGEHPECFSEAQKAAEFVFPELKESEDERIKKTLIKYVEEWQKGHCMWNSDKEFCNKVIAWLEKQGEQKTEIEYIYPRFRIGDVIVPIKPNGYYPPVRVLSIEKKTKSYYCESDDHNHYSSIPIRCENEYKLVEQKPSWSEEDEANMDAIWKACGIVYGAPHNIMLRDWLKSLKDRVLPQPKQEWSEDDSWMLNVCCNAIDSYKEPVDKYLVKKWLKSLKPQPKQEWGEEVPMIDANGQRE